LPISFIYFGQLIKGKKRGIAWETDSFGLHYIFHYELKNKKEKIIFSLAKL